MLYHHQLLFSLLILFAYFFLLPFLLLRATADSVAAAEEFISEGYIGGVLQIAVDEVGLLVAALEHHELVLQFCAGHLCLTLTEYVSDSSFIFGFSWSFRVAISLVRMDRCIMEHSHPTSLRLSRPWWLHRHSSHRCRLSRKQMFLL